MTTRLREARDPSTPPSRLQALGESRELSVAEAVAENPNTPLETLFLLGERFPHALLRNPLLPLLILEGAAVVRRMPEATLARLLALPEAPPGLVELAACDPREGVRLAAARHPALSGPGRELLVAGAPAPLRVALAREGSSEILARILADEAEALSLPVQPHRQGREDQERPLYRAFAGNPASPPQLLSRLALRSQDRAIQFLVAENPSTPEEALRALASEPNAKNSYSLQREGGSRNQVAGNPGAPPSLLGELAAYTGEPQVQEALAQNPRTPPKVLLSLAGSERAELRWLVAANPAAPPEAVARLVEDPDPEVRAIVQARRGPSRWPVGPRPPLRCAARLDLGDRQHQEDRYEIRAWPEGALFLVADGMGGASSGDLASEAAARTIAGHLEAARREAPWGPGDPASPLLGAFLAAHREVLRESWLRWNWNIGAAAAALLLDAEGAWIAHVGDSRVYRLREGALSPLTQDHSLINEYQRLLPELAQEQRASLEQFRHVITRALGMDVSAARPVLRREEPRAGDLYLLCSDGISRELSDARLAEILSAGRGELERCADALIEATKCSDQRDNISLVLVELLEEEA